MQLPVSIKEAITKYSQDSTSLRPFDKEKHRILLDELQKAIYTEYGFSEEEWTKKSI